MRIAAWLLLFSVLVVLGGRAVCREEPSPSRKSAEGSMPSPGALPTTPQIRAHGTYAPRPELATATIELHREPQQPDEVDSEYKIRRTFVDLYDQFRAEAKLSPEQERAVLCILADAQLNAHAVHEEAMDAIRDAVNRPGPETERRRREFDRAELYGQVRDETFARVADVLTDEQFVAWNEHLGISTPLLAWGEPLRIR